MNKLQSEVDIKRCYDALELLRVDTTNFLGWTKSDLNKLSEYMKVLSFTRNQVVVNKYEIAEYFGIVLSGSLLVFQVNQQQALNSDNTVKTPKNDTISIDKFNQKPITALSTGDMIGYMGLVDLPGTKVHQFKITGDKDGFIGIIRYDDFKLMNKKDPALSFKLVELAGKKALNMVHLQYNGEETYSYLKLPNCTMNIKKVKDALESCPELDNFFSKLEPRDKKSIMKYMEYVEYSGEQKITKVNNRCDTLFFLLKGELASFKDNRMIRYKPGAIIGRREFLFGLTWQENIIGTPPLKESKGIMLKLERDSFIDLQMNSPQAANALFKNLILSDCMDVRERFENKNIKWEIMQKFGLNMNGNNNGNMRGTNTNNKVNEISAELTEMFFEIDITKKYHSAYEKEKDFNAFNGNMSSTFKDFIKKKETLPLYMHDIFKTAAEDKAKSLQGTQKKSSNNDSEIGSEFLMEKLTRQLEAQRQKKREMKGKTGGMSSTTATGMNRRIGGMDENGKFDNDYEELRNEYGLLEGENAELKEKISELTAEKNNLKQEIKQLKEMLDISNVNIKKGLLHKELLSKDLINQDNLNILNRNYSNKFSSFGDVLNDQYAISKRAQKVAKFAYKWLYFVREKKKFMS